MTANESATLSKLLKDEIISPLSLPAAARCPHRAGGCKAAPSQANRGALRDRSGRSAQVTNVGHVVRIEELRPVDR
jgi:hypothetical protein